MGFVKLFATKTGLFERFLLIEKIGGVSGVQQAGNAGQLFSLHKFEGGAASSKQAPYPSFPPAVKTRSFHCFSSPHRTRFAGLRFG